MTTTSHPYRVFHQLSVPADSFIAPARTFDEAIAISDNLVPSSLAMITSNVIIIQVWDGEEWVDMNRDTEPYMEAVERYREFAYDVREKKP